MTWSSDRAVVCGIRRQPRNEMIRPNRKADGPGIFCWLYGLLSMLSASYYVVHRARSTIWPASFMRGSRNRAKSGFSAVDQCQVRPAASTPSRSMDQACRAPRPLVVGIPVPGLLARHPGPAVTQADRAVQQRSLWRAVGINGKVAGALELNLMAGRLRGQIRFNHRIVDGYQ